MRWPLPVRYLWSGVALLWMLLLTGFIASLVVVTGALGFGQDRIQRQGRFWARSLLWVAGCRVSVTGLDNLDDQATYVFASNHASALDILALLAVLPKNFRWIAKKELFGIPLFGASLKSAGYIAIDRSDHRAAVRSINEAAERIKEGASVVIFPEGTRSQDGLLLPFKSGGFMLALRSGRPVVPVAIVGSHQALAAKRLLLDPGPLEVRLGQPIPTQALKSADRDALAELTRGKVLALLGQAAEPGLAKVDTRVGMA